MASRHSQLVLSCLFLLVFGALFAHHFTDTYGRRYTFIVAALGFIVGILIQSFSTSYEILMFGRVFVGLGVGTGLAIGESREGHDILLRKEHLVWSIAENAIS